MRHQYFGDDPAARASSLPLAARQRGRRAYQCITIVTLLMMVIGGVALTPSAARAASTETLDDLNLRAEPALNAAILDVMPAGSAVEVIGEPENGFYPVSYDGQTGYAYGDYLTIGGGGGGFVTTGGQQGEVNVADGPVNFRSGPSLSDSIIAVIPDSGLVALTGDSANGFYGIIYSDQSGWAAGEFIFGTPVESGDNVPVEVPAVPAQPDVSDETPVEEPVPEAEEPAPTEVTDSPTEEPVPPAEEPADVPSSDDDIVSIIYAAADEYGQPREDMLRVATCESELTPTAVNPTSQASGLFQFLPSTWETTPYADEDIFDPVANARAAAWMWDNGRRNEWVCQ